MPRGAVLKFHSASELLAKGMEYINKQKKDRLPLVYGELLLHLDIGMDTFSDYEKRAGKGELNFAPAVKKLKTYIWADYEKSMRNKKTSPIAEIFALKQFGWKDKSEVDVNTGPITISWTGSKPKKR